MVDSKKFYTIFKERRAQLIQLLQKEHPDRTGVIALWAGFEQSRNAFRQESSFYYFTGIREPGVVLVIEISGKTTLYIPHYPARREQWVPSSIKIDHESPQYYGVDEIVFLGAELTGYCISPFFSRSDYTNMLALLEHERIKGGVIYTLNSTRSTELVDQKMVLERITRMVPVLEGALLDISSLVARMRRTKSKKEIELLYKAIDVTIDAHQTAAYMIKPEKNEAEVQAILEYRFTQAHARPAFPSIVAGGKNATILHYHDNNALLHKNELVVVDIGADLNYYCADLTRTYPVSGEFTKRQKELYELVLQVQEEVAKAAKPGVWLNNKDKPEQSLQHIALRIFEEHGYARYFIHSIGHFLGIDVHDVGDAQQPLQDGDVITIEPGLYIPEENIGIRIEDNYWIIPDGAMCLSENLPRTVSEIEQMVKHSFADDEQEEATEETH